MKATHQGHYQVCDRVQMLPGGKLAKHGYNVRWGFFSGVCWGARALPYEQDASLITKSIADAQAHIDSLIEQVTELRRPAIQPRAWLQIYESATGRLHQGGYRWIEVDLVVGERYGQPTTLAMYEGKERREAYHNGHQTPHDAATALNAVKAGWIERGTIREIARYLVEQRRRLAEWKPNQPLIPVERAPDAHTEFDGTLDYNDVCSQEG